MSPLWGGRFTGQIDPLMDKLNASLPFDWRLWDADITGSVAWARATCRAGLLTEEERDTIIAGLEAVQAEIARDPAAAFAGATDEDIHSYVERRLTEQIGAVAGKLHTGRSRNDQIATDVRLWLKWQIVVGNRSQGQESAISGQQPASSFQYPPSLPASMLRLPIHPLGRRTRRGRDRRADARLHPRPAGAARSLEPLAAEPRLGLAARSRAAGRSSRGGSTSCRWAPARWRAVLSPSTA